MTERTRACVARTPCVATPAAIDRRPLGLAAAALGSGGGTALFGEDLEGGAQEALRGLGRGEAGVRRERDVGEADQRMVGRQRLGREYVQPGVRDAPALQRLDQRRLVDPRAARRVDQDRARLE